jgi:radical SAM superfamily enzyme YgiQ (UPF0313 family)
MQQADVFLPRQNPTFGNPTFAEASFRLLIARLSPFSDVNRSLPHLFLFQEARRAVPDAFIDMAFFPARAERDWFERARIPPLIGVQSLHALDDFDLVLFSASYVLELINVPYLLLRAGLPLFSSERGSEHPIVILGGSNAMASQALFRVTDECTDALVDGAFFGEGEGLVERLIAVLAQPNKRKAARLSQAAAEIEGFWAAGISNTIYKATCNAPAAGHLPIDYPLLNGDEADTAHLQINYGCPAFCTFCFEAYDRRPYREIPLPDLVEAARRLKRTQGARTINLYSFNFNTHQDILGLLHALHLLYERVSFQSQRVDILQHTPTLLESEIAADKRSFTVGIEGISDRQRAWLHKSLPAEEIVALLDRLLSSRVREVKLFYLLTGHETEEDVVEFRRFVRSLKAQRQSKGRRVRVVFSFGMLIRMPFTPLRYDRLYLDEDHWRPLIGQVKSACETNGFEFRLAFDWPAYAVSQVLALGGHWLVDAIVSLAQRGYCFDTELPSDYWEQLRAWMQEKGYWTPEFLGPKGLTYTFALSFVRSNVSSEFLYRQFLEARDGRDTGYCLGGVGLAGEDEQGHCLACGACVSPEQRSAILGHQIRVPDPGSRLVELRKIVVHKRQIKPLYARVRVARWLAGAQPAFLNTLLLRCLLALHPEWTDNLYAVDECLFSVRPNDRRFPPLTGDTVFALKARHVEPIAAGLDGGCLLSTLGLDTRDPAFETTGWAPEGFQPGAYARLGLDLGLPAQHFTEPRVHLERHLRDAYLPYSLRRESPERATEVGYRFDVPKKGLRKKILWTGRFTLSEAGMNAQLEIGPGFDLRAFLDSFADRAHYYAQAHITSIQW